MGLKSLLKGVKKTKPSSSSSSTVATTTSNGVVPTRWEKAVLAMNGIVKQVAKIDPDGVDVICFPGSGGEGGMQHDIFRNVKDTDGLEALVNSSAPTGPCELSQALRVVFDEMSKKNAMNDDGTLRLWSVLVLTAGCPDDHEGLTQLLRQQAQQMAQTTKNHKECPLSITFVQVGDDARATNYLQYLDTGLIVNNEKGQPIDIVDTVKDEDIQKALKEMKQSMKDAEKSTKKSTSGATGALAGAIAGAAMGVGGLYMVNKMYAKRRKDGWSGKWKAAYEGEEIAVLKVKDDKQGSFTIKGWPEKMTSTGNYIETSDGGLSITHSTPDCPEDLVLGAVEDEHTIEWDDGTKWEEVPPKGVHWTRYAGAAVAGAAVGGATGYLLEKKFFKKASCAVKSDYVIVLDRSKLMAELDEGK